MPLPGFDAESSLGRSRYFYRAVATSGGQDSRVLAQQYRVPTWCRSACSCCRWKGLEGCCDTCFDCMGW